MSPLATIIGATLIWLAAVVSPGPNFLVVSRLALSRSRGSAIGAALGIAVGSLIYAALTMFGLSVLILRFAWLGDTIRIVGGAYVVWLGIQAWRARPEDLHPAAAGAAQRVPSVLVGLRVGFLTAITNPKTVAFFLDLFAAAVPAATPLWAKLACCQQAGSSRSPGTRPCPLRFPPVRCGRDSRTSGAPWSPVIGTLLIAVGLKVTPDAR
jgi:threonine/homoserine/homoserine lactone efflux protein